MSETPELDKMAAVREQSATLSEFWDFLQGKNYHIAYYHEHDDGCYDDKQREALCGYRGDDLAPLSRRPEELFAEFFDIDLKKVEKEKQAILDRIRDNVDANHSLAKVKKK